MSKVNIKYLIPVAFLAIFFLGILLGRATKNVSPAPLPQQTSNPLQNELNETKLLVSQLLKEENKTYCPQGEVYKDPPRSYRICYPLDWERDITTDERVKIISPTEVSFLTIEKSRESIQEAVSRINKEITVQTSNPNFKLNEIEARQILGVAKNKEKRLYTIFTLNSQTYIVTFVGIDTEEFNATREVFDSILESFTPLS